MMSESTGAGTGSTADELPRRSARAPGALEGLGRSGDGEAPNRAVEILGRVGIVAYGVVNLVVGLIAVQVALSGGNGQADQQGALSTLAGRPFGETLLVIVVVGLLAFAIWQGTAAATGFRWTSGWDRLQRRAAAGAYALGVLFVAAIGVQFLLTGSPGSSATGTQTTTAGLLALPGGPMLVGAVGLGAFAVAGATAYTGASRSFLEDLDRSRLSAGTHRPITVLGVVGHVLRSVAFVVIGVLFLIAAIRGDPTRAGGLDPALHVLAGQAYGPILLLLVAIGFAAFGLYTVAEAWARRV